MTVQATARRAGPTVGNSAATVFPFAFKVFLGTDLQVVRTVLASGAPTVLVLNDPAGYTVALNADQNANPGGSVIYNPFGVPLPATDSITITSIVPQVQGTHIINGGAFFANNIEDAIDKVLINLQDLALNVGNSVRFPASDSPALNAILPNYILRANQALLFDSTGNVVVGAVSNAPISSAWQPVVAAPSLAAGRLAMGFSAYFDSLVAAATKTAFDALISPLTTKGDLWVFGAANQRKAIGADGLGLVADSAQADGLNWASVFNDSGQSSVASAATTPIFAAPTSVVLITGTADITAFDASTSGKVRLCRVGSTGGMLTFGSGIGGLPSGVGEIQMVAGDYFTVVSTGANCRVSQYQRVNGMPLLFGRIPVSVLPFGVLNLAASATNYLARGVGVTSGGGTEGVAQFHAGEACTITELRGVASAALAGGTAAFTLRKNGADTALTATLAAASGTTFSDTTHSVDFDEGDMISVKAVTGAIGSTTDFGVSFLIRKRGGSVGPVGVPTQFWAAAGAFSFGSSTGSLLHNYTTSTETDAEFPVPACRIRQRSPFYALWNTGGTYVGATVRKNAAIPNGLFYTTPHSPVSATGMAPAGPVSGPTVGFVESDLFNFRGIQSDSDATHVRVSMDALGPSDIQYPAALINFLSLGQLQATTRFAGGYVGQGPWQSATETDCQLPMPACTLRNLRVVSSSAVAAGQTTVVTIRKNGVNTGVTCTLTSAGRLASDLVNSIAFAAGDILSVQVAAGATTGTRTYIVTIEVNP